MSMRYDSLAGFALFFAVLWSTSSTLAQTSPVDTTLASQYFREARMLCRHDNGELWGTSLWGPILFVDAKTRAVVASHADQDGILTRTADVFVGTLPERMNIANTSVDWAGLKWTMMIWPPPEDPHRRANLMAHELWHRIQGDIGFPSSGASNSHLDSRDGRIWLQLEWRALAAALTGPTERRRQAITDALLFRARRKALFPQAACEEQAMEMHEGLAEYTGVRLSGHPNPRQYVADNNLQEAARKPSFVRSFAYASGPAYGLLLDETQADWRRSLKKEHDLGTLLQKALTIELPQDIQPAAESRAKDYDGEQLQASEEQRERNRQKLLDAYRAKLVDGSVLEVPLRNMRMQFNPGNLVPFDSLGTVYPDIRIVDEWGILTVSKGALMNSTFSKIYVSAPSDLSMSPIQGDGWTLELNSGWTIAPGSRPGDYVVKTRD